MPTGRVWGYRRGMRDLIHKLIKQVDGAGFTDAHGHALENNQAYIDLKAAVTHDGPGLRYNEDEPIIGDV